MIAKITDFSIARYGKLVSAISTILILLLLPEFADARKPPLGGTTISHGKTGAGFHYMMGGLGFDQQQAMERQSARYNLKLVFALRPSIATPVLLLIGHNQSRRVEKVMVHAPWFYIQLPAGGYTIMARIKKKLVLIRDVYLREDRRVTYFVYGD